MKRTEGQRPWIEKVANDNHAYMQSLLEENQRLTQLVAEMMREESLLKERLAAIETERQAYSHRYVEVEQQNTNLANLYVATYQLHGTLNREAVLAAIKEIVINLIGSEELAVWELDERTGSLQLVDSFGIDEVLWDRVGVGMGVIGGAAQHGARFVRGESNTAPSGGERALTAAIPLKLDERVVGVIGIFSLLPQKAGLEAVDYELFDVLTSHAASALFCTRESVSAALAG
ncbi:MAG TPA: GAF domain-containing protein [Thermoanaerobaculia bacterium]|nr:GAF domain-containing protein [Thermoanaerobaculia bacterium]